METIVRAESWILRIPFTPTSADVTGAHHEIIGVTVESQSAQGMGFTYLSYNGGGMAVKALLDELLIPRLLGRSALDAEAVWAEFFRLTHRMGTGLNRLAMSAVDIALWDLRSTIKGVSLARELGRLTERVPVYGSGKAGTHLSTEELVDLSVGYVKSGMTALKLRVGAIDPSLAIERVAKVREAVGHDVRILCDGNEKFTYPDALAMGRRLADYDVFWFEEPVLSTDLQAHVLLAEKLPMLIVGGEHHCSMQEFVPYAERDAFAVLQPNICLVGGYTEMRRIMYLAELYGKGFAPHLMTELHVPAAAATASTVYVEYFPFLEPYITTPLVVEDGYAQVPDTPGHGVEFTDDAVSRYRTA